MNFLEERIVKDGIVKEGNILKVDSFLNHQMDTELFRRMGEEFVLENFSDKVHSRNKSYKTTGFSRNNKCIFVHLSSASKTIPRCLL